MYVYWINSDMTLKQLKKKNHMRLTLDLIKENVGLQGTEQLKIYQTICFHSQKFFLHKNVFYKITEISLNLALHISTGLRALENNILYL